MVVDQSGNGFQYSPWKLKVTSGHDRPQYSGSEVIQKNRIKYVISNNLKFKKKHTFK